MYQTLITELQSDILIITINRSDKLNTLNKIVLKELDEAIDEVYNNAKIKAAIITGSGEKAFVAGADISEFTGLQEKDARKLSLNGQDLFFKIEQSPKPIIACVNGFALGGGCELAMSCHLRLATDNAKFSQPEINLGLIPGFGGTQRLIQLIGKGRALELLLTGNMIDAATALQYGLVNYVLPKEQLLIKATEILQVIISKAPLAVAKSIACANAYFNESIDGFEVEKESFAACFTTTDSIEGVNAFLEKRKPVFTGN